MSGDSPFYNERTPSDFGSGDGKLYGMFYGRVTDIKDPEHQGRIKAVLNWQVEGGQRFETDWLTRVVDFCGPTKLARGRIFGSDPPLPEVESLVVISFNGGDPYDGMWFGQPRYLEGPYGAPDLEKDKYRDWSHRREYQSGTRWCIDSEGNVECTIVGGLRIKVQGPIEITSGTSTTILAPDTIVAALAVLQLIGVTIDQSQYPRPEQAADLRKLMIDSQRFEPGFEDIKIQKVPDLE